MKRSLEKISLNPRAFKSKAFRRYTYGNVISWTGDWMDLTVLNWAVLEQTGSPAYLGVVNACRLLPVFALSVPAGIIADKFDRRKVIFALQILMMIMTFVLGLAFAQRWGIVAISSVVIVRASLSAVLVPLRSVYSTNLVDKDSIKSAAAVHATAMNLSRIVGPALGGYLLIYLRSEHVFYLNALSFCFVMATLVGLREVSTQVRRPAAKTNAMFGEVLEFMKVTPIVRTLFVVSIIPMVFGFPYTTLMPLVVKDILNAGPLLLGVLLSSAAVGAVIASIVMTIDVGKSSLGAKLSYSIFLFGLGLAGLSLVRNTYQASALLVFIGYFSQVYRTSNRAALLVAVPDELRGRIMSIAMMDRGFIPLGTVLITLLIERSSTSLAVLTMGLTCSLCALFAVAIDRSLLKLD